MNSFRLLKIIFVILLLVTFGEVGYYVYYQFSIKKDIPNTSIATSQINIPTLAVEEPTAGPEQAISSNNLRGLKYLTSNDVISATMDVSIQGIITKVDTSGGIEPGSNAPYKLRIDIKGEKVYIFVYPDERLKKVTVVKKDNDKEVPMSIYDLKVGDKVIVYKKIDLKKPEFQQMLEHKIIRI